MTSPTTASNAPRPIKVGGKTYLISKLTIGGRAAFEEYAHEYYGKKASAAIDNPQKLHDELTRIAGIGFHDEECNALYRRDHHVLFLLWLCVRTNDAALGYDAFVDSFQSLSDDDVVVSKAVSEAFKVYLRVQYGDKIEGDDKPGGEKKTQDSAEQTPPAT